MSLQSFLKHLLKTGRCSTRCLSYVNAELPINKLQSDTLTASVNTKGINRFTERTCTCGELTLEHVNRKVVLCGWLAYLRMDKFVVIRDSYGHTQLIFDHNDTKMKDLLGTLPYESIIKVEGKVVPRPEDMVNRKQKTGEIEVLVEQLTALNKAENMLPFNIREFQKAKEPLRLQYRYLDLRFLQMQYNLRTRSSLFMAMRDYLVNYCHFVDVETPTLFKATPGGAQEFVVPTRSPGLFYSLVQSPQQFKQMLMAGAIDRYFQIARCYRDEGARSDRQPEFTQLDIEMSFTTMDGVVGLVEELLQYSWPRSLPPLPKTFARMSYRDALENYGTDKPDTRYSFLLQNCTKVFDSAASKDAEDFGAYAIIFRAPHNILTGSVREKLSEVSKQYPGAKLAQYKIGSMNDCVDKFKNHFGNVIAGNLAKYLDISADSVAFLSYGKKADVLSVLGRVRAEYVSYLEQKGFEVKEKGAMEPLWVTDFPLFEEKSTGQGLAAVHHPFTAPHPDDIHLLEERPLSVRSLAYDLVLNGSEIGGGSIRIHDPKLQEDILKMLHIEKGGLKHILDMLASGCPPHGGIALGLDRLLAVMLQTTSIRDVIAFPKTYDGSDPISGAPSPISEEDKKLYHIVTLDS